MLEQGMMAFALLGAGWVLWLLVGLSVACVAIAAERTFLFLRDGANRALLGAAVEKFVRDGDRGKLAISLKQIGGFESRILGAGLEVADYGVEAAERVMSGATQAERVKMERGLAVIGTVGSNAPFLGLFGTVLGIIKAFHDLAENVSEASEAVMAGISEALVATSVGLLVAIPAVVLFNTLSRWVKTRVSRSDTLAQLVLARLGHAPSAE